MSFRTLFRSFNFVPVLFKNRPKHIKFNRVFYCIGGASTLGISLVSFYYNNNGFILHAKQNYKLPTTVNNDEEEKQLSHLTMRERRFVKFASVDYEGQLYLTPQDFLESVTDSEPRPRLRRRKLTKKDLEKLYDITPQRKKGTSKLFRSLIDRGIISYTEYLFLLSVLTKPHSGFRIAFNMFDTDGNQRVDKQEFLVVLRILVKAFYKKSIIQDDFFEKDSQILEKIFSKVAHKRHMMKKGKKATDETEHVDALAVNDAVDTTLLIHLFGKKGNETLSYADFYKFMDNLQTEVLELEFTEFSRGMPTISEVDFAQILLRYTYIHSSDYDAYINRVQERIPEEKGISFEQFKAFCQFLNNLDDFAIAMRMFTYANQPISQEEFHRAVQICTGHSLDSNLVHTVFQIFDEDDDGYLSYKEFIAIMRDRLHRGFKPQKHSSSSGAHLTKNEGWEAFKSCVKTEMRS